MSRSVFKKRPRRFFGTPAWKEARVSPSSSSTPAGDSPAERPLPIPTASSKKLALSGNLPSTSRDCDSVSDSESYKYVGELCGIRLIDCEEYMKNLKARGKCPSPLTLWENLAISALLSIVDNTS